MSQGKNKLDMQSLPNEIQNMIMQHMQELYAQARADEERYQGFFQNGDEHLHIVMDTEDEIDTPKQQLVPYWIYNKEDKTFTTGIKVLDKINTEKDGIPINEMYRMPWKHPELNMGKAETFLHFSEQAYKNKLEREGKEQEQNIKTSSLLAMLNGVGTNNRGGGMKNKKVKKCEEKKVVLGKERCIYKVSGSKKDYMKYKGKLVPVSDYVKSMKIKN